jgi:hypothetical protein
LSFVKTINDTCLISRKASVLSYNVLSHDNNDDENYDDDNDAVDKDNVGWL